MRHGKVNRKFHRKKGQRVALLKGLMSNLILKEKIQTTEAKAKEIQPRVERLITLGKKQDVASLRLLLARLSKKAAQKLFYEIALRYKDGKGGYTRIIKSGKPRMGDGAKMALIEFV